MPFYPLFPESPTGRDEEERKVRLFLRRCFFEGQSQLFNAGGCPVSERLFCSVVFIFAEIKYK